MSHLPAAPRLPLRLITATPVSDGVHNSMLDGCFDFSPCDTSVACQVALCLSCELSATGAHAPLILLSVFTNRARVYKRGQHGTRHVKGQEALGDTMHTCAPGVTSHQSCCKCAAAECSVLKDALCANKPHMKP